jgi:hypothetical protein
MGTTHRVARFRTRLRAAWGTVTTRDSTTHQLCRLPMVHRSIHQGHRLVHQHRLASSSTTRLHGGYRTLLPGSMPWSSVSRRWATTLSTTPASCRRVGGCYPPFIMIGIEVSSIHYDWNQGTHYTQQPYPDPNQ